MKMSEIKELKCGDIVTVKASLSKMDPFDAMFNHVSKGGKVVIKRLHSNQLQSWNPSDIHKYSS